MKDKKHVIGVIWCIFKHFSDMLEGTKSNKLKFNLNISINLDKNDFNPIFCLLFVH